MSHANAPGPAALDDGGSTEVPDLKLQRARYSLAELKESSTFELVFGPRSSIRRQLSAFVLSFVAATLVRQLSLSPLIFGRRLAKELAPIERSEVEWLQIALVRVIDLIVLQASWHHSGRALEGSFLSALLTTISRVPMYTFLNQHFLIGSRATFDVFVTDLAASLASGAIVEYIVGRTPSFRRSPAAFYRRLTADNTLSIILAVSVATMFSALSQYVADRELVHNVVRKAVVEQFVPSYLSSYRPSFAFSLAHPLLPMPVLRSDAQMVSMPQALSSSAPLAIALTLLTLLVLPQSPSRLLALFAAAVTGPATAIHLHNLFPLKLWGAAIVGAEIATRAAGIAFIVGFILADVRGSTPTREIVVVEQVVAVPRQSVFSGLDQDDKQE